VIADLGQDHRAQIQVARSDRKRTLGDSFEEVPKKLLKVEERFDLSAKDKLTLGT